MLSTSRLSLLAAAALSVLAVPTLAQAQGFRGGYGFHGGGGSRGGYGDGFRGGYGGYRGGYGRGFGPGFGLGVLGGLALGGFPYAYGGGYPYGSAYPYGYASGYGTYPGYGYGYEQPPVVYAQPPVVYTAPQTIIQVPPPIYVQPQSYETSINVPDPVPVVHKAVAHHKVHHATPVSCACVPVKDGAPVTH